MEATRDAARQHYAEQLREAEETRQKLILSVLVQLEYLRAPVATDLHSWSIPELQRFLAQCSERIWERHGKALLEAVKDAHCNNPTGGVSMHPHPPQSSCGAPTREG